MKKIFLLIHLILYIYPALSANASSIDYLVVEGIINPVSSEFITTGIENAQKGDSEAIIIQLDTPGGLDISMREIVKKILSSTVPIVVYVAPSGSRAASAGVFITYAAHIAVMTPGTNIGSAHPVAMGGRKMDEIMLKKVENDAVAYIKGIAKKRGRNIEWAEKAVRESVNITAEEALKLNVIDLISINRDKLLESIDGKMVGLPSGARTLRTKGIPVKDIKMGTRLKILRAISNPNIAYILMMLGLLGLYFELSNPGAILPGVIGAISLILAFYAFQTLTVNYAGLALIALAIILFIAEINILSYGVLTVGGIIALLLGSLMLFESPLPFMKLSLWIILPSVILFTLILLTLMYYAIIIHKKTPVRGIGKEGLIGKEGKAETDISKGGKVYIDGEYWEAWADESIKKGALIKVQKVKGLKVKVTRLD